MQQKSSEMSLLDSENYFLSKTSKIIKIGSRSSEIGPSKVWPKCSGFSWKILQILRTAFWWFLTKNPTITLSFAYLFILWLQKYFCYEIWTLGVVFPVLFKFLVYFWKSYVDFVLNFHFQHIWSLHLYIFHVTLFVCSLASEILLL